MTGNCPSSEAKTGDVYHGNPLNLGGIYGGSYMKVNEILIGVVPETKYSRFLQVVTDPEGYPSTYAEYKVRLEVILKRAKGTGAAVLEVEVDPDELASFCAAEGLEVDAKGRNSYNLFTHHGKRPANGW